MLQGIGAAMLLSPGLALVTYLEPFSKRLALFEKEQVSKSAGQHFSFFLLKC